MKKLLATLSLAACAAFTASAATINLANVTGSTTLANGDVATGTLGGNYKISIAAGATVTLRDAIINDDEVNDLRYGWAGLTCIGDATIILEGENIVKGFYTGIPGIFVEGRHTLTIKGSGSLYAQGCMGAAGIGGGTASFYYVGGNIVINGGEISAMGGLMGAGIGSGAGMTCGNIVINGGFIAAVGGSGGAGIGSGSGGSCGSIAIKGGIIAHALGCGYGVNASAGIGSGASGKCGVIMFGDGTGNFAAAALSEGLASPIGAGKNGSCDAVIDRDTLAAEGREDVYFMRVLTPKTVNLAAVTENVYIYDGQVLTGTLAANVEVRIVEDATVTLRDVTINGVNDMVNCAWAGLTCEGDATIILEGNNTVKGFYENYPGIYVPEGYTLTIKGDGSLDASSNGYGAGIGGGWNYINCGNIRIEGGTITATGGYNTPGIGSGSGCSCGDITITKAVASVTATKGSGAPYSIGASSGGSCGTVTVGGVVGEISQTPYTYYGTGGGTGGGAVLPAPAFAADGKAATTEFVKDANGKWTLTTFAEMSNDALGSDVANGQIKVYAAPTVEGLNNASPMTSGVTVKGKKSAVMTTIEVTPPGNPPTQFFKVKFGE